MSVHPKFMTTEELAERWRSTPACIAEMRHRGRTPARYRIGRRVLYRVSDVEALATDL